MIESQQERRFDPRYAHPGLLTVSHLETGLLVHASIRDLSLGGCSVELQSEGFFLEGMVVELNFSTSNLEFRALGTVRYCDRTANTLGIAFVILSKRGLIDMETLMLDLDKYQSQMDAA